VEPNHFSSFFRRMAGMTPRQFRQQNCLIYVGIGFIRVSIGGLICANFAELNIQFMWTKEKIGNQAGKTVMVTGANTGIGYETALAMCQAGAHVVLACRSQANADQAKERMGREKGGGALETAILDLGSLAAVKTFAAEFCGTIDDWIS